MAAPSPAPRPGRRWPLIALIVIFVAPIVVAFVLNATSGGRPVATINNGTLVPGSPSVGDGGLITVPDLAQIPPRIESPLAAPDNPDLLRDGWTLLTATDAPRCEASCLRGLYTTRQVRWALGRNMDRMHRILVATDVPDRPLVLADGEPETHARLALGSGAWLAQLKRVLPAEGALEAYVFVIDPLGRLVLFYPLADDPGGLIKDLQRLLRLSKIG